MGDQECSSDDNSELVPTSTCNTDNHPGIFLKSKPYLEPLVKDLSELNPGDHCRVYRFPGIYSHGIVSEILTDNTFTLICYNHFAKRNFYLTIMCVEMDFKNGYFYKVEYSGGCFVPDVVVKRALSRVGEQEYNMVTNSNEGFARWCKTGYGSRLYKWDAMTNYTERANPEDIKLGDKIVFRKMFYEHHAIVTDVQENGLFTLVEFQRDGINRNVDVNLEERKGYLYKAIPNPEFVVSPDIIVKNANNLYEMIQQEGEKVEYNLFSHNCQHLASFCQSGAWHSQQILATLLEFVVDTGRTVISSITGAGLRVGAELLAVLLDIGFSFRVGPIDLFSIIGIAVIEFIYWLYNIIKYRCKYLKAEKYVREELLERKIDSVEYRDEVAAVDDKYIAKMIEPENYMKLDDIEKEKYKNKLIDDEEYKNDIACVKEKYIKTIINSEEYTKLVGLEQEKYRSKMIDITQRSGVVFISVAGCSSAGSLIGSLCGPVGIAAGSVIGSLVGVQVGEVLHKVILHIRRIPKEDWEKWLKGLIGMPKGETKGRVEELKRFIEDNSDGILTM